MAEALGAAVLTVSVDDTQLRAGLQAAQQEALRTAGTIQRAFGGLDGAFTGPTGGLQIYSRAAGQAQQATQAFGTAAAAQAAGLGTLGTAAGSASAGIQTLIGALGSLGIGIGAQSFLKGSIDAAIELETITRKLSNTLGEGGAAGALKFTRGLSDELGLSFKTLSGSFGSFTAAATAANVPLDTQKQLFAAVAKAGQSLGLSNYEIQGSLLALQQVASKGTVQMEELRGQLGERLPIAFSATAKGLGITQKELITLVESGKLTADQFFPALTKGLNELTSSSGGAATTAQNIQKLTNAWDDLQTTVGEGLLPTVTSQVEGLTQALGGVVSIMKLVPKEVIAVINALSAGLVFGPASGLPALKDAIIGNRSKPALQSDKTEENRLQAEQARQRQQQQDAAARNQKSLDRNLTQDLLSLQLDSIRRRTAATMGLATLEGSAREAVESRLTLEDKLTAAKRAQLQLDRELAKPKGAGDGKNGAQSEQRLIALQGQVDLANAEFDQAMADAAVRRVQAAREEATIIREAYRSAADSVRDAFRQTQDAFLGASELRQGPDGKLERNPGIATARLVAEQQRGIEDAARVAIRAADALERGKAEGVKGPALEKLKADSNAAGQRLELAGARAGAALRANAMQAAKALEDAQASRNQTMRGNFDLLTGDLQQEQLRKARAEVQSAVDAGVIRTGIPIGTPQQLFSVAAAANQIKEADAQVRLATEAKNVADAASANTAAIVQGAIARAQQENSLIESLRKLVEKKWNVAVNVSGSAATVSGDALAFRS